METSGVSHSTPLKNLRDKDVVLLSCFIWKSRSGMWAGSSWSRRSSESCLMLTVLPWDWLHHCAQHARYGWCGSVRAKVCRGHGLWGAPFTAAWWYLCSTGRQNWSVGTQMSELMTATNWASCIKQRSFKLHRTHIVVCFKFRRYTYRSGFNTLHIEQ